MTDETQTTPESETKALLATERANFEMLAYRRYLQQRAQGNVRDDAVGPALSPDELFHRTPQGMYHVEQFNAAWWAWQARATLDLIARLDRNTETEST